MYAELGSGSCSTGVTALGLAVVLLGCGSSEPIQRQSVAASPHQPAIASPPETAPQPPPVAQIPAPALRDRDLYEMLMRIARDPASVPELAPRVESIHEPMEGVDTDEQVARNEPIREPIADISAELRIYHDPVFYERDRVWREDEEEPRTTCTCDAEALRCFIGQPGGTTEFRFAREGPRVVLREKLWEYP